MLIELNELESQQSHDLLANTMDLIAPIRHNVVRLVCPHMA